MRISDWSSDVCSSDLAQGLRLALAARMREQVAVAVHEIGVRGDKIGARRKPASRHDAGHAVALGFDSGDRIAEPQRDAEALESPGPAGDVPLGAATRLPEAALMRSETRRVGTECVTECRPRGAHDN